MRAAGKRYQDTHKGKMHHAERQKRYRNKKVTHHSSQEISPNGLLQSKINEGVKKIGGDELRCGFCGRSCNLLLRTSPLDRNKTFNPGVWPLGP